MTEAEKNTGRKYSFSHKWVETNVRGGLRKTNQVTNDLKRLYEVALVGYFCSFCLYSGCGCKYVFCSYFFLSSKIISLGYAVKEFGLYGQYNNVYG